MATTCSSGSSLSNWWPIALRAAQQSAGNSIETFSRRRYRTADRPGIHLAVLVEPFLSFVLDGTKTVESRFTLNRVAPFEAVQRQDLVLLKVASGPVVGLCEIEAVHYFKQPTRQTIKIIRTTFGPRIRDDVPGFWTSRQNATYVSLLELGRVHRLTEPLACPKKDRRGWVVLRSTSTGESLWAR